MDKEMTFWEPREKTFYYLNLSDLRCLIAWGYDLEQDEHSKQIEHIGYDLSDGEYWHYIEGNAIFDDEEGKDYRSELLEGISPRAEDLLEDLAIQDKIPSGDYLLSVY